MPKSPSTAELNKLNQWLQELKEAKRLADQAEFKFMELCLEFEATGLWHVKYTSPEECFEANGLLTKGFYRRYKRFRDERGSSEIKVIGVQAAVNAITLPPERREDYVSTAKTYVETTGRMFTAEEARVTRLRIGAKDPEPSRVYPEPGESTKADLKTELRSKEAELSKLRAENTELKIENAKLKAENEKLHELLLSKKLTQPQAATPL